MHEIDREAVVAGARQKLSRRGFLLGAAGVAGAGVLMGMPGTAKAHQPTVDDSLILNYALTLEHLEATFYMVGVKRFKNQLDRAVYRNLLTVMNHERRHVTLLTAVINGLPDDDPNAGSPVPRLRYNFQQTAFTNVNRFLTVAALLENTGVSAYDGAIAHITSADYLTAGAQIATVEARHAAYLNSVKNNSPFPTALDDAVAPRDIATVVRDSFVSSDPDEGAYGPYDSFNDFLMMLPDTLQPPDDTTAARGSNDVNAQDTLREAEEAAE